MGYIVEMMVIIVISHSGLPAGDQRGERKSILGYIVEMIVIMVIKMNGKVQTILNLCQPFCSFWECEIYQDGWDYVDGENIKIIIFIMMVNGHKIKGQQFIQVT